MIQNRFSNSNFVARTEGSVVAAVPVTKLIERFGPTRRIVIDGLTVDFPCSLSQIMTKTATPLRLKTRGAEVEIDPRFQNRESQPGLDLLRALAIIVVV